MHDESLIIKKESRKELSFVLIYVILYDLKNLTLCNLIQKT